MENPSNGVTIILPAAAAVIKDCATIANSYIPHLVFGSYGDPFSILAKKVSLEQIQDFVNRSKDSYITNQLLRLILDKGRNIAILPEDTHSESDPYGDYGTDAPAIAHYLNLH